MTKANIWAVRKQAGTSRWAIRLGRPIKQILEEPPPDVDVQMGDVYGDVGPPMAGHESLEMVAELWEIVLKTEDSAQALLKDKYWATKEQEKEGVQSALAGETGAQRYVREAVLRLLRHVVFVFRILLAFVAGAREVHGGKGTQHHGQLSAHLEATQVAPGALAFSWIKGEPHFRSRNSGDLINCLRSPKTPCKVYGHAHWYWQGMAHGCKGWFACKA